MSQMDGETKTIGNETFKVLMLDPLVANDVLVDIAHTVGPALGTVGSTLIQAKDSKAAFMQLLDGADKDKSETEGAVGTALGPSIEAAVTGIIDRLSKSKIREIIGIMESVSSVKKGDGWVNLPNVSTIVFRGKLKLMYQWLGFALQVQFKDFF